MSGSMKNTNLFILFLILLWPAGMRAADPQADGCKVEVNVNERYVVEDIAFSGVDKSQMGKSWSKVSKSWHEKAQKMVGEKYSEKTARRLADKLSHELGREYHVEVKVEKGAKADHVKVVFDIRKISFHRYAYDATVPLAVYHSKQGFSGTLEIPIGFGPSVFTFGLVSDADQLLERNAGFRLRYEHRKLGTEKFRLRMDFDSYHQKFNQATETPLAYAPDVPGIYRNRQNFAPSLSLHPTPDWTLKAGVSMQRLQMQYPELRTETAYAGAADIQYRRDMESRSGFWQHLDADYSLRTATRILESDFVYTRHFVTVNYMLSRGKSLFGAHFLGGWIVGTAPLFERFSLGNSTTLRGWNKFDVAPMGGARAAHGSLEYRCGYFQIFYDFGKVWDREKSLPVRHGVGFGFVNKHAYISLAFPVRLDDVAPVFMFGIRY
jgi:hypothetical protein